VLVYEQQHASPPHPTTVAFILLRQLSLAHTSSLTSMLIGMSDASSSFMQAITPALSLIRCLVCGKLLFAHLLFVQLGKTRAAASTSAQIRCAFALDDMFIHFDFYQILWFNQKYSSIH
jgi:hypothetical protein